MDFHDAQEMWTPTDFSHIPQRDRMVAGRGSEQLRAQIRECEAEIERCARQLRDLRMALARARTGSAGQDACAVPPRSRAAGTAR